MTSQTHWRHQPRAHRYAPNPAGLTGLQARVSHLQQQLQRQSKLINLLHQNTQVCPVTTLFNERGFSAFLAHAAANFQRFGHTGALLVFRVENLDLIGQHYGEPAAAATLQQVAAVLRNYTHVADPVAHLGQGIFALFLAQAEVEMALRHARRLRQQLMQNPLVWRGTPLAVEFSAGIATLQQAPHPSSLLALAQSRLQRLHQALAYNPPV